MNEELARTILGEMVGTLDDPNDLTQLAPYVWFIADYQVDPPEAQVDGWFTADQLDALAWWVRNKSRKVVPTK